MNKEQIVREKIVSLFRKYNMEGSMTQMFVCRYFDTKDINDLKVLERAKLNPQLKIELTNLLRSYFNSTRKVRRIKKTAPKNNSRAVNLKTINQMRSEHGLKPIESGDIRIVCDS